MSIPWIAKLKGFFGFYVYTPLELDLLGELSNSLSTSDREILSFQMSKFTTIRRFIESVSDEDSYGFTNFYTTKFGKNISDKTQIRRFNNTDAESLLAKADILFSNNKIEVKFWVVHGILFSIEYKSKEKIYYPPDLYSIKNLIVWPNQHGN